MKKCWKNKKARHAFVKGIQRAHDRETQHLRSELSRWRGMISPILSLIDATSPHIPIPGYRELKDLHAVPSDSNPAVIPRRQRYQMNHISDYGCSSFAYSEDSRVIAELYRFRCDYLKHEPSLGRIMVFRAVGPDKTLSLPLAMSDYAFTHAAISCEHTARMIWQAFSEQAFRGFQAEFRKETHT